jgi:hypothetical protein
MYRVDDRNSFEEAQHLMDRFKRIRDLDDDQWSHRYNQWKGGVDITTNYLRLRDGDQTLQPIGSDEHYRLDKHFIKRSPPQSSDDNKSIAETFRQPNDASHLLPDMFPAILVATQIDRPTPHRVVTPSLFLNYLLLLCHL